MTIWFVDMVPGSAHGLARQDLTDPPFVDLERDEARRLAEQELADPIYEDEPPLLQRGLEWILRQLDRLFAEAGDALSGWSALILLIPVAIIVALVLWRFGPMARTAVRGGEPLFGTDKRSAADYRRSADDALVADDWTAGVLERFRALVAGLEERHILPDQAGRTADEAARDAGRLLPDLARRLRTGAVTFDDVRYGERAATRDEAMTMRDLEWDVRSAWISPEPADDMPWPAVPR